MPETQATEGQGPKGPNSSGNQRRSGGPEGSGVAGEARTVSENATRSAEQVIDKTAQASQDASRATGEILRRNIETAQGALQSGMEGALRSFETLTRTMTGTFGFTGSRGEQLAEESSTNVKVVAEAAAVVAKGAQDVSREWFKLTQNRLRTNLEALGQLASCRTAQDVISVQSNLMRQTLEQVVQSGQSIAEASRRSMDEASRLFQARASTPQHPAQH